MQTSQRRRDEAAKERLGSALKRPGDYLGETFQWQESKHGETRPDLCCVPNPRFSEALNGSQEHPELEPRDLFQLILGYERRGFGRREGDAARRAALRRRRLRGRSCRVNDDGFDFSTPPEDFGCAVCGGYEAETAAARRGNGARRTSCATLPDSSPNCVKNKSLCRHF